MTVDLGTLIGSILGGLGLFLLAVGMMTDGLKHAAGNSLRQLLATWTKTPLRGVASGFFITAIVQSSSAVTVASIGFVNAGLLSMHQALGVVYGANIGTTITGWLVALIGFKLNIQAFALPLIGLGMIARLVKKDGRVASLGMAAVGFGLFFVGIDLLKSAFDGIVAAFDISQFTVQGLGQILLFLVIGIVMTILTQSSSASIALTITAAATGVVGLYAAAAMIIGANVGTTSTALIASIGATANAKRVALAQVLFNVGTAIVALVILPLLFLIINGLERFLSLQPDLGVTLAMFHTVFNCLGVLLIFPLNNWLATFLSRRFNERQDKTMRPQYLDKAIAATPVLAVNALVRELEAIAGRVRNLTYLCLSLGRASSSEIAYELKHVRSLSSEISKFIVTLQQSHLTEETSSQLATLLRIDQYFLSCAYDADTIYRQFEQLSEADIAPLRNEIKNFQTAIRGVLIVSSDILYDDSQTRVQSLHDQLKVKLLAAGSRGELEFDALMTLLDVLGAELGIATQWIKAIKNLKSMSETTNTDTRLLNQTTAASQAAVATDES